MEEMEIKAAADSIAVDARTYASCRGVADVPGLTQNMDGVPLLQGPLPRWRRVIHVAHIELRWYGRCRTCD